MKKASQSMKKTQSGGLADRNALNHSVTASSYTLPQEQFVLPGCLVYYQHFAIVSFSVRKRQFFVQNVLVLVAFLHPNCAAP